MPNWIEGTLRMRGSYNNIKKFIEESIQNYETKYIEDEGFINYIDNSEIEKKYCEYDGNEGIFVSVNKKEPYIEGTVRAFVTGDFDLYTKIKGENEYVICIPVKQAWGWMKDNWESISKKYDVDIRIVGWESGMEYEAEILCIRGKEAIYTEKKYSNWNWESPCPLLGG